MHKALVIYNFVRLYNVVDNNKSRFVEYKKKMFHALIGTG